MTLDFYKKKITASLLSKIEVFILIIFCALFELINSNNLFFGQIIYLISILSNIHLLITYRRNNIFIIFLLFSLIHIVYISVYYFFNIPYHYILDSQSIKNTNTILFIQFIFLRLLFTGIPKKCKNFLNTQFLPKKKNNLIYLFCIGLLIFMFFLSNRGLDSISFQGSKNSYSIETKSSIWFEYCLIPIIAAYIYANNRPKKTLLFIVSLVFILSPIFYGKRLPALMVSLLVFILFFNTKVSPYKTILLSIIGFVLFRLFAIIRVNGVENVSFWKAMLSISEKGVLSNGPGGVLVCSVTYLDLIKEDVFSIYFSLKSFIGQFSSILLPASKNFSETYINLETLKYKNIPGNGGFPGIYLFIWGRYIGLFIGGIIINHIIKKGFYSYYYFIFLLFLFSTFPRWYTYNMTIIIKMGAWLMLFIIILNQTNKILNFKKK